MDDDQLRHWQEVDHHLTELAKHPGWGALIEFSHWRMKGPKHAVLNGNLASFEKYLKETGWLRGIHDTLDAPKTVKDMVTNELERRRALQSEG